MSRIGKEPINIPKAVNFSIDDSNVVTIKGPKGELSRKFPEVITFENDEKSILCKRPDDLRQNRALHGLSRSLLANMVTGVSEGYKKDLEIVGVGYKAEKKGKNLMLSLGYSHPIIFVPPEGIEIEVAGPLNFTINGINKELVGECAAKIRSFRKPEPYKGKGIRYKGEYVARKAGKYAK